MGKVVAQTTSRRIGVRQSPFATHLQYRVPR
jgi:hypothetical protein